jgi:3'-phosphoadenosine 5'-phosphosulfate (PAPS) 3'-phosphatase
LQARRIGPAKTSSSLAYPGCFRGAAFSARKRGPRHPEAATVWVIDPIDGTHNFLTGIPFWCVSVGLVVAGELVLGIMIPVIPIDLMVIFSL